MLYRLSYASRPKPPNCIKAENKLQAAFFGIGTTTYLPLDKQDAALIRGARVAPSFDNSRNYSQYSAKVTVDMSV
jgi:hypothetical protein